MMWTSVDSEGGLKVSTGSGENPPLPCIMTTPLDARCLCLLSDGVDTTECFPLTPTDLLLLGLLSRSLLTL